MDRVMLGATAYARQAFEPFAAPASPAPAGPDAPVAPAVGPVMALEGIGIAFGGVRALKGVDLVLGPGEILAVIGPNGAGKSSLVNIISGLYRPDEGRVVLDGEAFAQVPAQRLSALGVARTFQNLALFGGLSVRDNVAAGLTHTRRASVVEQIAGLPRARRETAAITARVDEMLEFLHLERHADRIAGALPYGLQKRVEFARALVAAPKILLLDEPMAGMTASDKVEVAGFVRAARDRLGTSVILIEHDLGVVMGLSDRIAVLDYGRKIADGPPAKVRADPGVIAAYIGAEPMEHAA